MLALESVLKPCNINDLVKDAQRNNEVIEKDTTGVIIPTSAPCKMKNANIALHRW